MKLMRQTDNHDRSVLPLPPDPKHRPDCLTQLLAGSSCRNMKELSYRSMFRIPGAVAADSRRTDVDSTHLSSLYFHTLVLQLASRHLHSALASCSLGPDTAIAKVEVSL